MFYIADLHVHSHYSRATSKNLNLVSLHQWANIKGIQVVGTGDFTHPGWLKTLEEQLIPDDHSGFYVLKNLPPPLYKCQSYKVKFCLTTEISSIYKHAGVVRKNHNLLYAPDFDTVKKINYQLSKIGNLKSDGRPILGLSARDLLEIVKKSSDRAYLIPAHIWTPWFSTLGSKSGYDSIQDCFRDLTPYIFAVETGLSSDPMMNWRVSALDQYTLISNSDAHSPQKLGREANMLDTDMTYDAMFQAIQTKKGFLGTLEFFPEEGKYHMDGHRNCHICTDPLSSQQYHDICPVCKKKLTIGVLHRVSLLADRPLHTQPANALPYMHIVPLPEIISEIKNLGDQSKGVAAAFQQIIGLYGNEFSFLREVPLADIHKDLGVIYAQAVERLRAQKAILQPGYDGVYGKISFFQPGEIEKIHGQLSFFQQNSLVIKRKKTNQFRTPLKEKTTFSSSKKISTTSEKKKIIQHLKGNILVKAGPGTGKTYTLVHWIQHILQNTTEGKVLAITFTNQAVASMQQRVKNTNPNSENRLMTGTFHGIAYDILREEKKIHTIYTSAERRIILQHFFDKKGTQAANICIDFFEKNILKNTEDFHQYIVPYLNYLNKNNATDLLTMIYQVLDFWKKDKALQEKYKKRYTHIAIDELQDINFWQYAWIKILGKDKSIFCIGDPDQSIYQFRGSDVRFFFQFVKDFMPKVYSLTQNYRSTHTILQAASNVIAKNKDYTHLKIKAQQAKGKKITLYTHENPYKEAHQIVAQIQKLVSKDDHLSLGTADTSDFTFADISILFRTKKVGHVIWKALQKANIPTRFIYAENQEDSIQKICIHILKIFVQSKNIFILQLFLEEHLSFSLQETKHLLEQYVDHGYQWSEKFCDDMTSEKKKRYLDFYHFYQTYQFQNDALIVLKAIFQHYIQPKFSIEGEFFFQTVLYPLAYQYPTVVLLLKNISLHTQAILSPKSEQVHLLTLHAAKGLEFPIVFIAGAEEDIMPLAKQSIEEERRLFYVALTRAKQKIFISHVQKRSFYGVSQSMKISRFVEEIPANFLDKKEEVSIADTQQLVLF